MEDWKTLAKTILAVVLGCILASCRQSEENSICSLKNHFSCPPQEARPMVWWHWMDGNITKDGIRKDLEWMDRSGIRGFHLFDAALATRRVVDERLVYMTPQWQDAFRYALDIADSLGMEAGIASSPGWTHSGGPWVKPEDAMKKLVWREITVCGDRHFEEALPEPFCSKGPFLNATKEGDSLYEDIAVLALRQPEVPGLLIPSNAQPDLLDDDLGTGIEIRPSEGICRIEYQYPSPVTVRSLTVSDEGGHGPMLFYADGKPVCEVTVTEIGRQTVSFPAIAGRRFTLETSLSDPGIVQKLLGGKKPESLRLTEFRLESVSRIHRAEAKAGFETLTDLGQYPTPEDTTAYAPGAIDLSDSFHDGVLTWDIPKGTWKVYRFGWSLTGKENSPAPQEATGLEVDKLDPDAWTRYFKAYLDMYRKAAGGSLDKIQYLLTDSWEAGCETWTPRLREEFLSRRGYDLLPWMPVLAGDIVESVFASERFLLDWRLTLEELIAENFDRLTRLLHDEGLKGRYSESHEQKRALIADGMDIKRSADIPMSALWMPGPMAAVPTMASIADMKESSSVSHIYGQPFVAAESMTSVGLFQQAYTYYPGNLKPIADLEFACGINRIIIHESTHQPSDDKVPGLGLSITGQWFNRHETWAEQARPWTDYLARTSYLLGKGKNVADVLVYYGDDTNITARYGEAEPDIPEGLSYDYVNSAALRNAVQFKKGTFSAVSGNRWRFLVIDADVIPDDIQALVNQWKEQGADICSFAELAGKDIPADLLADNKVRFVHRRMDDADIFWVSNPSAEFTDIELSFREGRRHLSIWDPETGEISRCDYFVTDNRTLVSWDAQPDDAKFFVFSDKKMADGKVDSHSRLDRESPLTGPWHISFQEGRGAPSEAVFDTLHSFTESEDTGIRYFSGTAAYSKEFTVGNPSGRTLLSLGEVHNLAEVIVNGQHVRTLWKVPYEVEITDYMKEGANSLEIRVTNLWPNRLIGDAALPESERLTYTGFPFYGPDDTLLPSGLIGPVRILQ